MKQVILDFDGVIADTFDFHLGKINDLYEVGLTAKEYFDIHDGNFHANTNEKIASLDFTNYGRLVGEEQSGVPPFPYAIDSVRELSKMTKLHLVTSGWEAQIFPFLRHHDIFQDFSSLKCADLSTSKHEKLEQILKSEISTPENFIFVTDTLGDLYESHAVGIETIAVTFGFQDEERLKIGSPNFIAHSWPEVMCIIKEWAA
jgi:phosphoglycolate phosphatase-like HAD superfamily hydrolase